MSSETPSHEYTEVGRSDGLLVHPSYRDRTSNFSIWIRFPFQHLVLGIKFAVAYAIPDIPEWVENEIAKMEFQRREALKVYDRLASHSTDASDLDTLFALSCYQLKPNS